MMRRTTELLNPLNLLPQRRQDAQREQSRRGDAHRGAQRAFQNAQQQPHSHVPRPPGEAQGAWSGAHASSRKGKPARDGSHPSPRSERTRSNERVQQVQQDPSMNQLVFPKPLPPKPENEGVQANTWYQDGMGSNENGPPIGNNQFELDADTTVLPRVTDVSKISGTWAGTTLQRIEIPRPEEDGSDSITVMGKIYHHLRKVKIEFPSVHLQGDIPYPCLPADIERAILGLIQAYESIYRSARESENALKTKDADYESLRKQFNYDCAQIQRGFEDKIATLKIENEKALKAKDADYESLRKQFHYDWAQQRKDFEDKIVMLEKENEKEVDRLKTVISVLKEEHVSREQRHDDKMKRFQEDYQSEKTAMADGYKLQIQKLESEMRQLNSEHEGELNKLQKQHREHAAILQSANEEGMAEMQRKFHIQMLQSQESLRTTTERYEARLREMGTQHVEEKRQMTSRFDAEKTQANNDFFNEKATLSSTITLQAERYESQLMDLRKQNKDDKQKMEAKHQIEKAAMEKSKQAVEKQSYAQLGIAKENHDKEMWRKAEEIDKLKKEHECEKEKMRERHDAEKLELEAKRERENKSLRDDNEALKSALVKRDHFKAMSDHELAQRFQNLASEVDEFARVRWDSRRESTWPFPDQLLRNSENERRTKQHVVQNTLWVILYEKIFCTPFRVLGEGGKPLEREWIEQYGQDRKSTGALAPCPRPTKISEKWRYETMKKCLEATSQPLMDWEEDYNVKQGYELSVKETTEDISRELARVASVSGSDKQRMSDLVRKAARLWLEVGQQRCRMFLLMSHSSKEPSRSGPASLDRDRTQELVVVPELRRMGNAQGERLEKDELVLDCKGKFSVFYG